jgi:hypothetical protein
MSMFLTWTEQAWAKQIEAFRVALRVQWEWNHAEHCSNTWPHPEDQRCMWPLPVLLGGDPNVYRTYTEAASQWAPNH